MLVQSRDHVQLAESELSEYDKHGFRFYAITFTISVLYSSETTLSVAQGIHLKSNAGYTGCLGLTEQHLPSKYSEFQALAAECYL